MLVNIIKKLMFIQSKCVVLYYEVLEFSKN